MTRKERLEQVHRELVEALAHVHRAHRRAEGEQWARFALSLVSHQIHRFSERLHEEIGRC